MPPVGRALPYEALDPQWEAREFDKFRQSTGRQQAPYGAYLFGRLLQSDLHQSCRPALPPDVAKLNGSTIQGMCILQVVDVANIGANYEHRTEFSPPGPTRTLKLGLTDGHQLVFGFEFRPLPQFSVNIARGTKVVVENVPVRHGLLMLAADNCQLLESASDRSGRANGPAKQSAEATAANAGAYSAALVTSQFNTSQQPTPDTQSTMNLRQPVETQLTARPSAPAPAVISRSRDQVTGPPVPSRPGSTNHTGTNGTAFKASAANHAGPVPSVFVDVPSSGEDFDSDTTDPMVEHLFYSPKTPREPRSVPINGAIGSRKRPRSPSTEQRMPAPLAPHARQSAVPVHAVASGADVMMDDVEEEAYNFSLLGDKSSGGTAEIHTPADPTHPFQYFIAKRSTLSAAAQSSTVGALQVRACIKSVIGFQFNTGRYQLRVSVEDCTATREADVEEAFVTRLMGVPCKEFVQTMQTNRQVAHGWAATMQFALMNLEGIMTFKVNPTPTPGTVPLLLIDCRDYQLADTQALLQRVKASMSPAPSIDRTFTG